MCRSKFSMVVVAGALWAALPVAPAQGQGMPVIDVANLRQAVQNVLDDVDRYEQLAQTVAQLRATYAALTGMRNLAAAMNNPLLQNYLPPASYTLLDEVNALGGYGGADAARPGAARRRHALQLPGAVGRALSSCQATLAAPYQYKALINDAQDRSSQRTGRSTRSCTRRPPPLDPKAIAEAQARIGARSRCWATRPPRRSWRPWPSMPTSRCAPRAVLKRSWPTVRPLR
jgi:type IV secretion system protein VirB5